MAWTATLTIKDCQNLGTPLAGAEVFDGSQTFNADAQGKVSLSFDDALGATIVKVKQSGFISKNISLNRPAGGGGTQVTECLEPSPVGTADPNVPTGAGGDSGGCFILTAVSGSFWSPEIIALRAARDAAAAISTLAERMIAEIYREYALFSPQLASRLTMNGTLASALTVRVVAPLLAWYRLATQLALRPTGLEAIAQSTVALTQAVEASRRAGQSDRELEALLSPAELRAIAGLPCAAWAILDPLKRLLPATHDRKRWPEAVCAWLAAAPLDRIIRAGEPPLSERDVAGLRQLLSFDPVIAEILLHRFDAALAERNRDPRAGRTDPEAVPAGAIAR